MGLFEDERYRLALQLSTSQRTCPVCLRSLVRRGMYSIGDMHHVFVRRGPIGNDDSLWVPENIALVHHACHMDRGSFNIHAAAMIARRCGVPAIEKWLESLPFRVPPDAHSSFFEYKRLAQMESVDRCRQCGFRTLHHPTSGSPQILPGLHVCWRCFSLTDVL